jgi:protein gp37
MTKIEWTEATWNPIVGCSIVSPGCTNCYAMGQAARLLDKPGSHYKGTTQRVNGKAVWTGKVATAPDAIMTAPLRRRKTTTYFVNSMGDLFHEGVPDAWIDRVFAIMALAPQHTFQVLTKRAERMRIYLADKWLPFRIFRQAQVFDKEACQDSDRFDLAVHDPEAGLAVPGPAHWPLPNVWLGVSAEDQRRADERIPDLLVAPAAMRFVSAEPLLGPIDFTRIGLSIGEDVIRNLLDGFLWNAATGHANHNIPALDWIIVGGESGRGARPMHPDWTRSIRDQCAAAGVPFFFKQWGSWSVTYDRDRDDSDWRRCGDVDRSDPKGRWLNLAGGHGFHGDRVVRATPTSKAAAGRLLDGATHDAMPGRAA